MPAALTSKDPEPGPRAVLRLVDESDDYTSAVAGVTVEGARVGEGVGPNVVLGVPGDSVTVTSSHLGFPMTAGAHIPPDRIAAAFVHENTGGSRWCGVQLQPGSVIVTLRPVLTSRTGFSNGTDTPSRASTSVLNAQKSTWM